MEETRQSGVRLLAARSGMAGLLVGDLADLSAADPEAIAYAPGSAIGSSRHALGDRDYDTVLDVLRRHEVRYLWYTGGNGSMSAAAELSRRLPETAVIGIPKTIDNDLTGTDHAPGYGSAARFAAIYARDAGEDNRSLPSPVMVVETIGRDSGWVVAATALARHREDDPPHLIYVPEDPLPEDRLLGDADNVVRRLGRCVVAVCEGQRNDRGEPFGADMLPNTPLAANLGHMLARFITERLGVRARAERPGLLGRSCAALASEVDRAEARECGRAAVRAALAGETGKMVSLGRPGSGMGLTDLRCVGHRVMPAEYFTHGDVTTAFLEYVRPLVGDVPAHGRLF
jgi:6-phosphofructokinase 1